MKSFIGLVLVVLVCCVGYVNAEDLDECKYGYTMFGSVNVNGGHIPKNQIQAIAYEIMEMLVSGIGNSTDPTTTRAEVYSLIYRFMKAVVAIADGKVVEMLERLVVQTEPYAALALQNLGIVLIIRASLVFLHFASNLRSMGPGKRWYLISNAMSFLFNLVVPIFLGLAETFAYYVMGGTKSLSVVCMIVTATCLVCTHISFIFGKQAAESGSLNVTMVQMMHLMIDKLERPALPVLVNTTDKPVQHIPSVPTRTPTVIPVPVAVAAAAETAEGETEEETDGDSRSDFEKFSIKFNQDLLASRKSAPAASAPPAALYRSS